MKILLFPAFLFATALPALAHAHLVKSTPAEGAKVKSPAHIARGFSLSACSLGRSVDVHFGPDGYVVVQPLDVLVTHAHAPVRHAAAVPARTAASVPVACVRRARR